jgi:serine/threonine-protein kinase RsbW
VPAVSAAEPAPVPGSAPPPADATHRLRLRNDPGELERLGEWTEALSLTLGLAPDVAFAADLCLQEAVGNVIEHAFADGAPHEIGVSAVRVGRRLIVEIEDDGRPFDPLTAPPPAPAAHLEDVRIGGLGVHLIRRFASGMRYTREGGRNRLTLTIGPPGRGTIEPEPGA